MMIMDGNQPKRPKAKLQALKLVQGWRLAGPMIAAGLGAHIVVVMLSKSDSAIPLLTALLATLVFATVSLAYAFRGRGGIANTFSSAGVQLLAGLFVLAAVSAGVWLTGRVLGMGAKFYCEPLVPWRIEIALFGSFAVGYLTFVAHARQRAWAVYPLAMIALLWIAPFYGFFSGPLFLGISLNNLCSDRSVVTVFLTALGMIAGEQAGRVLAQWMTKSS